MRRKVITRRKRNEGQLRRVKAETRRGPPRGRGAPVRPLSWGLRKIESHLSASRLIEENMYSCSRQLYESRARVLRQLSFAALSSRSYGLSFRAKITAMMTRFYSWTRSALHFYPDLPLNFIVFSTRIVVHR